MSGENFISTLLQGVLGGANSALVDEADRKKRQRLQDEELQNRLSTDQAMFDQDQAQAKQALPFKLSEELAKLTQKSDFERNQKDLDDKRIMDKKIKAFQGEFVDGKWKGGTHSKLMNDDPSMAQRFLSYLKSHPDAKIPTNPANPKIGELAASGKFDDAVKLHIESGMNPQDEEFLNDFEKMHNSIMKSKLMDSRLQGNTISPDVVQALQNGDFETANLLSAGNPKAAAQVARVVGTKAKLAKGSGKGTGKSYSGVSPEVIDAMGRGDVEGALKASRGTKDNFFIKTQIQINEKINSKDKKRSDYLGKLVSSFEKRYIPSGMSPGDWMLSQPGDDPPVLKRKQRYRELVSEKNSLDDSILSGNVGSSVPEKKPSKPASDAKPTTKMSAQDIKKKYLAGGN